MPSKGWSKKRAEALCAGSSGVVVPKGFGDGGGGVRHSNFQVAFGEPKLRLKFKFKLS